MKKRLITIALMLAVPCAGINAFAAENGDIWAPIYSTDILTQIDGRYINSYNIGGTTMICLEDLKDYGFTVQYDDSIRTLFVNKTHEPDPDFNPAIERGKPGEIIDYARTTDIQAVINGNTYFQAKSIGGKLAVPVENLGIDKRLYNFGVMSSMYYMSCTYNDSERMLYLSTHPEYETTFKQKIAEFYSPSNPDLQYMKNIKQKNCGSFDIITFDYYKPEYHEFDTSLFMLFYHDGTFISPFVALAYHYQFASTSSLMSAYNGFLTEDGKHFEFDGYKNEYFIKNARKIEEGHYTMDLESFVVILN